MYRGPAAESRYDRGQDSVSEVCNGSRCLVLRTSDTKEHQQVCRAIAGLNFEGPRKRVRQKLIATSNSPHERTWLPREPFGKFDQNAPVGGIADVVKRNDQPQ